MQKFILFFIAVHFTFSAYGSESHISTSATHQQPGDALPPQNESYNYEALMEHMDVLEKRTMEKISVIKRGCDQFESTGKNLLKKLPEKPFKFFNNKTRVQIIIESREDYKKKLKKAVVISEGIEIIRQYIETVRNDLSNEKNNPAVLVNKKEEDPKKKIWWTKQRYLDYAKQSIDTQLENLINRCHGAVRMIEENLKLYEEHKPK